MAASSATRTTTARWRCTSPGRTRKPPVASAGGRRTRRRRRSGPPTRTGPGTGWKTARCGRSRPVTRDRVPSSATVSCASAPTAPGRCRTGPTRVSGAGGYARNALALLAGYAASIGANRLEAHAAPDNHASRHVAEAVGFTQADTFTDGDGTEFIRYARDASGDGPAPSRS